MIKRILNVSHNDPDGIAAALAVRLRHFIKGEHVVTKFAGVGNIHDVLFDALTQKRTPYQRIVLSDISFKVPGTVNERESNHMKMLVNYYLPQAIRDFVEAGGEFVVLDHHPGCLEVRSVYSEYLHPDSICELIDSEGIPRAGSELAARYYAAAKDGAPSRFDLGLYDICRICGDFDLFRDVTGQVGKIARGIELMNDCQQAMNDMLTTLTEYARGSTWVTLKWGEDMHGMLGRYIREADSIFQTSMDVAMASVQNHTPTLSEVYAPYFGDFVAAEVYNMNKGAVIVRYDEDRSKVDRLSLRRHKDFPVNLGAFAKRHGGGGHSVAAGMPVDKYTLNEIVHNLVQECATLTP